MKSEPVLNLAKSSCPRPQLMPNSLMHAEELDRNSHGEPGERMESADGETGPVWDHFGDRLVQFPIRKFSSLGFSRLGLQSGSSLGDESLPCKHRRSSTCAENAINKWSSTLGCRSEMNRPSSSHD